MADSWACWLDIYRSLLKIYWTECANFDDNSCSGNNWSDFRYFFVIDINLIHLYHLVIIPTTIFVLLRDCAHKTSKSLTCVIICLHYYFLCWLIDRWCRFFTFNGTVLELMRQSLQINDVASASLLTLLCVSERSGQFVIPPPPISAEKYWKRVS